MDDDSTQRGWVLRVSLLYLGEYINSNFGIQAMRVDPQDTVATTWDAIKSRYSFRRGKR